MGTDDDDGQTRPWRHPRVKFAVFGVTQHLSTEWVVVSRNHDDACRPPQATTPNVAELWLCRKHGRVLTTISKDETGPSLTFF